MSDAVSDDSYLTVKEIAERLRVSRMTVYRLVHSGELPSSRIGHNFRVLESSLATYLEEH